MTSAIDEKRNPLPDDHNKDTLQVIPLWHWPGLTLTLTDTKKAGDAAKST